MAQPLTSCLKGLFLIFNFVFWISGLALLVVGIMTKFTFSYFMKLSTDIDYNLAPYLMIGCGVFVVLMGFCGCWAAIKQHGWALKLYMFVLIILVICEIGGAITGYVLRGRMSSGLKEGMNNAVKNYYTDKDLKSAMDEVQGRYVKCCGVNSYKDYFTGPAPNTTLAPVTTPAPTNATIAPTNSTAAPTNATTPNSNSTLVRKRRATVTSESVPMSCCINSDGKDCHYKNLAGIAPEKMGIYTKGCYDGLVDAAKKNFAIVGGVALGIALFQLLGVACAFFLIKQFKKINTYDKM